MERDAVPENGTQSIVRAFRVLDVLARSPNGAGVRQIAAQLGIPKSVAGRILQTLVDIGFSVQEPGNRRYLLGPRSAALGEAYVTRVDLMQAARPRMTELRDQVGETISLNVRSGRSRICVAQVESLQELRAAGQVGRTYPLDTGAPGRVLLAALPDEDIEHISRHRRTLCDYIPHRQLDDSSLWETLREIRTNGIAVADQETMRGVCSVAAPLRDHTGHTVAALGVLAPYDRFGPEEVDRYRQALTETAQAIEATLGRIPHEHAPA